MHFTHLELINVRGFRDSNLVNKLAKNINIFVGPNNAGKTTILKALLAPQILQLDRNDISIDKDTLTIHLSFADHTKYLKALGDNFRAGYRTMRFVLHRNEFKSDVVNLNEPKAGPLNLDRISVDEPDNLIYPYFAKRKVNQFAEDMRTGSAQKVSGDLSNLYAKVDRLSDPEFPAYSNYVGACDEILGFRVSSMASDNGKRAGLRVTSFRDIPLPAMGEGVPNLLGLIVDICIAEDGGKVFIIEEPENDVHPKALRSLLQLIQNSSEKNQFFISTHSNIVTKHLGAVDGAKVFRVAMEIEDRIPRSTVIAVPNEEAARRDLLEELGYEFQDYDLHKAWLFLEESSAESVVRDFLIPTFARKLVGKIRTFSASGIDKVKSKLDDFNRLFVFLNLQPVYKNLVWVVVDEGAREKAILDEMRSMYEKSGWLQEQFIQLQEHDFENYYPTAFRSEVERVLAIDNRNVRRAEKMRLIQTVKAWWLEDPAKAKVEFAKSAEEVIKILKQIEKRVG